MASGLEHRVVTGESYPVVKLTGVLDTAAAPTVRYALLDVLSGQPEALVVDVSDLRVTDPDGVGVFRDVARDTTDWPDAHMVICGAGDAALWQSAGLPVWPDQAGAFAALGSPDAGNRLYIDLEPVIGAARRSRELATEACGRWDCPELAGPACIVLTEMVNNVVVHARTAMTVLLARHGETMSVAVRDHSTTVPHYVGMPAPSDYGGRGLLLIDSMASRWGNLRLGDGKVVWALLQSDHGSVSPGRPQMHSAGMADPAHG